MPFSLDVLSYDQQYLIPNEFKASYTRIPKGFCGFFDIFIEDFAYFGSGKDINKNLTSTFDICYEGLSSM